MKSWKAALHKEKEDYEKNQHKQLLI